MICQQMIKKYKDKQLIVAIEELSELQKELCKSLRGKTNKENITEEIADVLIMIKQLQIYFNIDKKDIKKMIYEKLKRTKERLLDDK